jgi:hypothetical protein
VLITRTPENKPKCLCHGPDKNLTFEVNVCVESGQFSPGLTPTNVPNNLQKKLATYSIRSPVLGGGGLTPDQVMQDLFPGQEYQFLIEWQRNSVRSAQRQWYQWRNHADIVFSACCEKVVQVQKSTDASPCSECT